MQGFSGDNAPATNATLFPGNVVVDRHGTMYIADFENNRIRMVSDTTQDYAGTKNFSVTKNELRIYPNPANEELHIDNVAGSATYSISNMTGHLVQQGTVDNVHNVIDVKNMTNGLYVISVTDEQGKRVVRKFVKQ